MWSNLIFHPAARELTLDTQRSRAYNSSEGDRRLRSIVNEMRTVALLREEINPQKTATLRDLGRVDLRGIESDILAIPDDEWDTATDHEANYNKGGAIRQACHIIFRFSDKRAVPFRCFDLPAWNRWRDRLMPIMLDAVQSYGYRQGFFPRIMLANLPAGGFIPPHVDGPATVSRPHKVHVPIVTNSDTFMFVGNERFHLAAGHAYEINNAVRHAVTNAGDSDRIHLIVEYLDAELQPFDG
jgi:hypothetical protein